MAQTKKRHKKEKWFDTNIVVEVLIGELSSRPDDAPAIANLCIGFDSLSKDELKEAIEGFRAWKPKIFPKKLSTADILKLIEKRYKAYSKITNC